MIIYPKYIFWVFIYTILFSIISIFYGHLLEQIANSYDTWFAKQGFAKTKVQYALEIGTQLGATAVGIYVLREYIDFGIRYFFKIDKKPDKFAALIISAVVFSQQPSLIAKIKRLF